MNKTNSRIKGVTFTYEIYDNYGQQINSGQMKVPSRDDYLVIEPNSSKEIDGYFSEIHKTKSQKLILSIVSVDKTNWK